MRLPSSPLFRAATLVLAASIVAACSSGSVNTTPLPQPVPSSATVATSTTATTTLPTLGAGNTTFSGSLGVASIGTSLTEALSLTPPNGLAALSRARLQSTRQTADDTSADTPIAYLTFSVPVTITVAAGSSLSFTLSSVTAGLSYFLATNDGTGWMAPAAGPGTVSGTTVTFSGLPSFTLTAGTSITLGLYSTSGAPTPTPSPSPSPTPVPTPTPTPVPTPVVSPNSIVFDVTASPSPGPVTVTVTESGFSGPFTASISCTANPVPSPVPTSSPFVAQLTPPSGTTFTVTPGNELGACTASFTDARNATATIPVLNGSSSLTVFSTTRR